MVFEIYVEVVREEDILHDMIFYVTMAHPFTHCYNMRDFHMILGCLG